MPGNWKDYRDWKKLIESTHRKPQEDEDSFVDDDVEDLTELFREYLD
jgi:hypothetical protein